MIQAIWRHFTHNYQEGGFRQVICKIFWRFHQWIWSDTVCLVYRQDLQEFRLEPRLPLTESALDFAAMHELEYFKAHAFPEAMQARLDSGELCHGYLLDRKLANLGWTSRGYLEIAPGVRIYEEHSIGIYDCYTFPAFRSRGIYTDSLIRMLRQIRHEGVSRSLIAVAPDNVPSIRAIEKVGFSPLYRATISQRFGRTRLRESEFRAGPQTQT